MDDQFWALAARLERGYYRAHNVTGRVTLHLGDDSGGVQQHQIEGYSGELRDGAQRLQTFGFASLPVPGAKGVATYHSGHRAFGTITADEDPRYRPKGQQPGEFLTYIVDGAQKDGTGGTMRQVLKGALGWLTTLFGKTVNIGDANTQTIVVGGGGVTSLTIKVSGSTQVTVQGGSGTPLAVKRSDGSNATNLFTT